MKTLRAVAGRPAGNSCWLVRAAVAAAISGSCVMPAVAQEPEATEGLDALQEVQITGSRIVRRDTETTSPLITVEREILEKNSYISIEQALNELPEFMAGGALMGGNSVTSLSAAGDVAGGSGTGNMFDTARPVDNARLGTYTPGAATLNLRGLGTNRSLTLVDGRRAVSSNASGAVDLNTIPQIVIDNIEVITGGASSVYGADALAGVTNIRLRNNFEGIEVRARGGINEEGGDGKEWQISTLMGLNIADKGHAMVGMDFSKREVALWRNRSWFTEAMESPLSNAGDYLFSVWPGYAPGQTNAGCNAAGTVCTTTNRALNAGGGSNNVFNNAWAGNGPSQAAINQVFGDRSCTNINCVTNTLGGYFFNPDGTVFVRNSNASVAGRTLQYGPQSFTGALGGTRDAPDEVTCNYLANQNNRMPGFQSVCMPQLNRVDYDRRLTSPREGYTLFANADFNFNENLTAYSVISFANSETETRREPAPTSGAFAVSIPYHSDPNARYLPSIAQNPQPGIAIGDTLPEYRAGGARGTNCEPIGGCTMQQAFPVTPEMRTLLDSRPDVLLGTSNTGGGPVAGSPFNGMSVCELRTIDSNTAIAGHTAQVAASGGRPAYSVAIDSNTGETFKLCGPNSAWRLQNQLMYLPPRGTLNDNTTYQFTAGLRGDLGLSDWTWDWHVTQGESRTNTEYVGYISALNYSTIMTAPNYGQGFRAQSQGVSNKVLTCTSGLNPFAQAAGTLAISQDCIDAVTANQTDRQTMQQTDTELNLQGRVFSLPAGEVRSAVGVSWRKNRYSFIPDSLRESDFIADTSAGQFGVGYVDGAVSVKEVYTELLIPLLRDLPGIRSLELELGGRYSQYTTGQDVPTYKAQISWEPLSWLRARGGYNRAERTPNIAELYTTSTVSSQLTGIGNDPCSSTVAATLPASNNPNNPNRAQLQALCSAQINAAGSNNSSTFHANPDTFVALGGVLTFAGNPNLKSEQGDTWTAGLVFNSPFEHALAQNITATVDWYKIEISDPIDVLSGQLILNACFNVDGTNPGYSLDDPQGYCSLIVRDPTSGSIRTVRAQYANIGELSVSGIDTAVRWSAPLADMGISSVPGNLSFNVSANFLTDQSQPVTVGGALRNFAGYVGASKLRTNTTLGYRLNDTRVSLTWLFRKGTEGLLANNTPSDTVAGYPSDSLLNLNAGSRFGPVDVSFSVSNLLNSEPDRGGWFVADETGGFGTFDPYGDLVGRRYSVSFTMEF